MDKNWEYTEKESKTYEVIAKTRPESGVVQARWVYRFWEVGDGDWKIQIIDSDNAPMEPIILPEKVIQKMINVSVKEELKK